MKIVFSHIEGLIYAFITDLLISKFYFIWQRYMYAWQQVLKM